MISNITNADPFLKKEAEKGNNENNESELIKAFKFFNSLFPENKSLVALKHLYIDMVFRLKPDKIDLIKSFFITIDTLDFVKDFTYVLDSENGLIVIRGSLDEFSILSLVLLGSIKNLKPEVKNKGIFISVAKNYLQFCLDNGYKACKKSDIKILEDYNEGFEEEIFDNIAIIQSADNYKATFHFIGVPLTKDILCIFEKYKDVKFDFNEKDASFIITMGACEWDDFWLHAPQNMKDDYEETLKQSENK